MEIPDAARSFRNWPQDAAGLSRVVYVVDLRCRLFCHWFDTERSRLEFCGCLTHSFGVLGSGISVPSSGHAQPACVQLLAQYGLLGLNPPITIVLERLEEIR